jgi:hypothetical protein
VSKRDTEIWQMQPTKGSEKEMTTAQVDAKLDQAAELVSEANALIREGDTTTEVAVTEAPSHKDATGRVLYPGDRVRVTDSLTEESFFSEAERTFDLGEVDSLNEDGTVEVYWDSAGCSCNGTRTEKATDLQYTNKSEETMVNRGYTKGYDRGQESVQEALRAALGISTDQDN